MLDFENLTAIDRKVSDEITGEDRVKMVDLMLKKQEIQERAKELDESQKNLPNPELDNVNNQINEIVTQTEEKIKLKQEYDQKDEQGVSSEVGEGQEPIETQPIEGASDQEVTTGGVVQEEQTEVTPTEDVVTETEITPTEEAITEEEIKAPEVTTEVADKNEFDELSNINKITSPTKKNKAMKAFNEKYGEKAARISEIDSKFTSIVNKFESQGIIKKKC